MNTEIYTYKLKDLDSNRVRVNEKKINNITYITENTIGNLYLPNSQIIAGSISYINNLVFSDTNSFNTSLGTIVTGAGSLVYNFNYILKFMDVKPEEKTVLTARPTFVSGKYLTYKNIKITVQILELTGERILVIEYE